MDVGMTLQELGVNPNRPIIPYDITSQLDALPLYDTWEGLSSFLDLAREIINGNDYFYQGIPIPLIPEGQLSSINGYATFSGTVTVPAYSYLVSLTHYVNQPEGFRIAIYDKGAKTDLIYNKFAKESVISSPMGFADPQPATISTQVQEISAAQGPRWLTSPMIILPPGTLQVEITNLAPIPAIIQVLFNFAIPFSGRATNIVTIGDGE